MHKNYVFRQWNCHLRQCHLHFIAVVPCKCVCLMLSRSTMSPIQFLFLNARFLLLKISFFSSNLMLLLTILRYQEDDYWSNFKYYRSQYRKSHVDCSWLDKNHKIINLMWINILFTNAKCTQFIMSRAQFVATFFLELY